MRGLHWPLVIFALLASVGVWFNAGLSYFSKRQIFMLRAASLLLLYNTALLMVGAPYTRYSIPFLPLIFGMAATAGYFATRYLRAARLQS